MSSTIFANKAIERAFHRMNKDVATQTVSVSKAPQAKHGLEIFVEPGSPRSMEEYVGQDRAKTHLTASIKSAAFRNTRLGHTLIATGIPGIGKTTLARLIAFEMGVGIVETQGAVHVDEAAEILRGMHDGDVWFIDEAHQLVQGGKGKAEWLLGFLQDGSIVTAMCAEKMPDVTIIAATTDAQMLPETILQRFPIKPIIEAYSDEDAASIALAMAKKIFGEHGMEVPSQKTLLDIVRAGNNAPRAIKALLSQLFDAEISDMAPRDAAGNSDLTHTLYWCGLTADGLDNMAQAYIVTLFSLCDGVGSKDTITTQMGESTVPAHTERTLLQRGYIVITGKGRVLTDLGRERAGELMMEHFKA